MMLVLATLYPHALLLQTSRPAPHRWSSSSVAEAVAPSVASGRSPAVVMAAAVDDPRACMGTWYVQQQVPALAFLEAGARNGVEQYEWDESLAEAGGGFSVTYTFNRAGAAEDDLTTVRQRGWVSGGEQGAGWKVAPLLGGFCPPVRLPFIILDVEPSAHLVCTGGAGSWMYVMTRERRPAPGVVEALLAKLEATGVDVAKLMPMEHTGTS